MHPSYGEMLAKTYPACRAELGPDMWDLVVGVFKKDPKLENFPVMLQRISSKLFLPAYLPELAELESIINEVKTKKGEAEPLDHVMVNPTLQLVRLTWKGLPALIDNPQNRSSPIENSERFAVVWKDPKTREVQAVEATDEDLLVIKMILEGMDPEEVAKEGILPVGAVDSAIDRATYRGILLKPKSRIRRDSELFPVGQKENDKYIVSPTFAIQWHITQACDLHCKHCYDRSSRSPLKKEQGFDILDDLQAFCRSRYVKGHVSFTGGNPLLHPDFLELYQRAVELGFGVAILGNPAPREKIEQLIAIQKPGFFQTSLEGLRDHNDYIRGAGHFDRVMVFLKLLRQLEVYSIIMLTLTDANIDQILPLSSTLRGRAEAFFFNRLSSVGEGADLRLPSRKKFVAFLEQYHDAARNNPMLGVKDNLFNILRHKNGEEIFEGCSGYGCGAAFNFVAILSDGEVHACRKFPSPIGNIFENSLADIYDSVTAKRYRQGCSACRSCDIRYVCGGCLAIAHSQGLDFFEERDPFCFMAADP